MTRRIVGLLVAGALALTAVGCGGTTDGTPTSTTTTAAVDAADLFDPCAGIPDDALAASGVDPATEDEGIAGASFPGWRICGWSGSTHFLSVFATNHTVQEFEKKTGNVEFQNIISGGRPAHQFRVEGASKELRCDALFPIENGTVVQVKISNMASMDNLEDPCSVLSRTSENIVPLLPE